MIICKENLAVPIMELKSIVTHSTPRIPTVFEKTILHIHSRLSFHPDFENQYLVDIFNDLLQAPDLDLFLEEALDNLFTLNVLRSEQIGVKITEIQLSDLKITERGLEMIKENLLPGNPIEEKISHFYDPFQQKLLRLSDFKVSDKHNSLQISTEPFLQVFPEEEIRKSIPKGKHQWWSLKTQIESIVCEERSFRMKTEAVRFQCNANGEFSIHGDQKDVISYLNEMNSKEVIRNYIHPVFSSSRIRDFGFDESALPEVPLKTLHQSSIVKVDSLIENQLGEKTSVFFTDKSFDPTKHWKEKYFVIQCLGSSLEKNDLYLSGNASAYHSHSENEHTTTLNSEFDTPSYSEPTSKPDLATVILSLSEEYPFDPCSCFDRQNIYGLCAGQSSLDHEPFQINVGYFRHHGQDSVVNHLYEQAILAILEISEARDISLCAYCFLLSTDAEIYQFIARQFLDQEDIPASFEEVQKQLKKLNGVKSLNPVVIVDQLARVLFDLQWESFYSDSDYSGADIQKNSSLLEVLSISKELKLELKKKHIQRVSSFLISNEQDWEILASVYQKANQKIPKRHLEELAEIIKKKTRKEIVQCCQNMKEVMKKYELTHQYSYLCTRLIESLYQSSKFISFDEFQRAFTLSQELIKEDQKLFSEIGNNLSKLIQPPTSLEEWKQIIRLLIEMKLEIPDQITTQNIYEKLLLNIPLNTNDLKLIPKKPEGKAILQFSEAEEKLCGLLGIVKMDTYRNLKEELKVSEVEQRLQNWRKKKDQFVKMFPWSKNEIESKNIAEKKLISHLSQAKRNAVKIEEVTKKKSQKKKSKKGKK